MSTNESSQGKENIKFDMRQSELWNKDFREQSVTATVRVKTGNPGAQKRRIRYVR